nr:MAG TPA: Neck appendage protein [Caudoviricetes sp.]
MDIFRRKKFDEAMFAKNRTLAIRVGQYQSSDIKEASFDYGYIKGDTYKPGGTCAGSAKIVFTSIITTFNKLDKVYPEIGLLVDGTYEWVKMGEYFINDIEIDRNRKTTKLDLMDGMFKLNREHVTDLTYPAEIRHVIKEICLKTGVKLANENMDIASMNYRIESIPKEKKMTFRDVLSLASQMLGMSCFFNREGKLEIKELTDSGITITADSYFMHGLTKSEVEYQIAGITCKKEKETLTVGLRTGRSLEIENVLMYQSALDNLYHSIKDIRYYPYNLNYQGHLLLEVGQWVTIKTNTGETFKSPVLSQSFNFKGGLRGRISADSKAGNDAQYSYAGTITKKIVQFNEFEAQIQNQIEEVDKGFDQKVAKIKKDFSDQVELAKAKTEEVKRQLSDTIDQRLNSFNSGPLQEVKRRAEEALRNAGASSLLAQEAKRIGLDSIAKLEEFKRQATSAQTALSGDLDALKRTVTSEVNQASEYRRTTTEALSRMTGQMNGFATKSEVAQGIDGLTQTFAKMKVGGRNYAEDYDFSRGLWIYSQGDGSPVDWKIINGEYNVKGTTNTWKQMQIHSKEGSRASGKSSTALLDLEIGETYTLSFQGICYSGSPNVWVSLRANRTAPGNPEIMNGNFNLTSSWQTYQVTIPALTKPDNFDFWRIILGYNEIGHVAFRKVELTRSSTRIDAGPAPEDDKTDLVVAKSEFQKTADGLSTKLATVENYVGQDGQRQEALRRYSREESARQATAVRELVTRDYVGKSTHQEDVRGIERRFEAITNPQNGTIATQIANYKQSVDGRLAGIISQIAGKANQTDFQRVQETSKLYERIIGRSESDIADKVARMALTNQLFQVEVAKNASNGQNLLKGTKDFSGDWKNKSANWKTHAEKYKGVDVLFKNNSWNGIGQEIDANIGEIYTFSLWMKSDWKNDTVNFYVNRNGSVEKGWGVPSQTSIAITNEWKRYSFTFKITANGFIFPRVERLNQDTNLYVAGLKLEKGSYATPYTEAPEDTDEAIRSVQSQLAGSWSVQNLTSAGAIVSQINATNNQILIEAEKIRLKGKTLLDELTAIDGYFKRLFVGEGEFAKLNAEIIASKTITADKLIMDQAMARMFVSSDIFTDTLAAKEAFINKLRSVVVTATLLEGFKGRIGGFQIGTHEKDSSVYWITGQNQFSVGMSNGSGHWSQTALWVNWGNNWEKPSDYAWFVKHTGQMYCYNRAEFWNTPIVHGDLKVTGHIFYNNENSGKSGYWIHSSKYSNFEPSNNYLYLYYSGSGYDWIPMNKEISDRRYKTNIEASTVSGLDVIESLKTYRYRKEYDGQVEDIACGIMAQDVQVHAPEAFFENPDGAYSYNTFALVPYLIKAIQELNQKIEKMEKTA